MNTELRWLIRPGWDGPEKVLQYRTQCYNKRYDFRDITYEMLKWTDWIDVPIVEQ